MKNRKQIKGNKAEMVSVINNDAVPSDIQNGAIEKEMNGLTNALYETAKYLLLNNKK
jgi:hypothetical protein